MTSTISSTKNSILIFNKAGKKLTFSNICQKQLFPENSQDKLKMIQSQFRNLENFKTSKIYIQFDI